jgi:hypothetical protein
VHVGPAERRGGARPGADQGGIGGQLGGAGGRDDQLMQHGARTELRRQGQQAIVIQTRANARQHGRANLVNHVRLEQRVARGQRDGEPGVGRRERAAGNLAQTPPALDAGRVDAQPGDRVVGRLQLARAHQGVHSGCACSGCMALRAPSWC